MAGLMVGAGSCRAAVAVPEGIGRLLPGAYETLSVAGGGWRWGGDGGGRTATVVALARQDEAALKENAESPARPSPVFGKGRDGSFRLMGRNDGVVMHVDEGVQCDPFLDGGALSTRAASMFFIGSPWAEGEGRGEHW